MKNEALYKKTVDILVDAYFNDTLRQGDPCGCAVGNMVAANNGITVLDKGLKWSGDRWPNWDNAVNAGELFLEDYNGDAKREIDSTGYSVFEIHRIEAAFEKTNNTSKSDLDMFNGLMAVIEVLDIIHENTDTEITTATKQKFVKQLV